MTQAIKFVIVEQNFRGRATALRNLAFETKELAEAHILNVKNERYRTRLHVETRAVKADDTALRMTCQCCAHRYLSNTGTIAHHGYQRPGWGWQTASCIGAKHLPFEADRTQLGKLIDNLRQYKKTEINIRDRIEKGELPIKVSYSDHSQKANPRTGKRPQIEIEVTRETFDAQKKDHGGSWKWNFYGDFEDLLKRELEGRDRRIKFIAEDIKNCVARFNGWKQTHKFNNKTKTWEVV